jgi:uncharacterized protein DUF4230
MTWEKIKKYGIIALVVVVVVVVVGFIIFFNVRDNNQREIISSTIEEKVSKIVELSTVKYNYTDIVSYRESKELSGIKLPFTEKRFIVQYSGYIKAGVDLSTIEIDIKDDDTIHINMKKAEILENTIIEEEVKFFDEKDGLFNKLSFKDLYSVLIGEKEKAKNQAINRGLLNESQDNAEEILLSLLEEMKFKNVIIRFK